MPRYFFNTADGGRDLDQDGTDLPDHSSARVQAVQFAGMALSDEPTFLLDGGEFRVEVTDQEGVLLFSVIMLAVDAVMVQ